MVKAGNKKAANKATALLPCSPFKSEQVLVLSKREAESNHRNTSSTPKVKNEDGLHVLVKAEQKAKHEDKMDVLVKAQQTSGKRYSTTYKKGERGQRQRALLQELSWLRAAHGAATKLLHVKQEIASEIEDIAHQIQNLDQHGLQESELAALRNKVIELEAEAARREMEIMQQLQNAEQKSEQNGPEEAELVLLRSKVSELEADAERKDALLAVKDGQIQKLQIRLHLVEDSLDWKRCAARAHMQPPDTCYKRMKAAIELTMQ